VDIPERYVRLCLRVARHSDGFSDAFIGPPEWQQSTSAEEPVDLKQLREEAQHLLDSLDSADLEEDRCRWLRGQLHAIDCVTARLSGEDIPWIDEVGRCLGVRPTRIDTSAFEDVHARLDAVLPGAGSLRDRYIAWDENNVVPRDKLLPALDRLKEVLRPRAHALAPMPAEESVAYEIVSNEPWIAYNWYQGEHRSRVQVNADLPISVLLLVDLAAHEAYPGHHTERTAKDAHLFRDLGRVETSVAITLAPEALVSEGIARNALEEALGSQPFAAVSNVLADMNLKFDPLEADEVHRAEMELYGPAMNAAFMLHEDGASTEEAQDYVREWCLESDQRAARDVAFIADPEARAYMPAYTEGRRLCRRFADLKPGNFSRLLTEQLTTADLLS
jgi:hypothetical protein